MCPNEAIKKAVVGKHDPMDRPRIYGFYGYRL
jgi:hypothetical protein